jgi:hypothetical protein
MALTRCLVVPERMICSAAPAMTCLREGTATIRWMAGSAMTRSPAAPATTPLLVGMAMTPLYMSLAMAQTRSAISISAIPAR